MKYTRTQPDYSKHPKVVAKAVPGYFLSAKVFFAFAASSLIITLALRALS